MSRSPRSDLGQVRITRRDLEVLYWMADQYGMRKDQIPRLLGGLGDRTIRALIDRWTRAGLVERRKVFSHEPVWLWPTRGGLGLLDRRVPYWEPRPGILDHVYWVNEVRMLVRDRDPEQRWVSERRLRAERGGRNSVEHMPDALVVRDRIRIAVEVQLTQKSAERAASMLRSLTDGFDGAWIFAAPGAATDAITRVLKRLDARRAAQVRLMELGVEE